MFAERCAGLLHTALGFSFQLTLSGYRNAALPLSGAAWRQCSQGRIDTASAPSHQQTRGYSPAAAYEAPLPAQSDHTAAVSKHAQDMHTQSSAFMHTASHNEEPQDRKTAFTLLSRLRQSLPSKASPLTKPGARQQRLPAPAGHDPSSESTPAAAKPAASASVAQTVQKIKLLQLQQVPGNANPHLTTGLQPSQHSAELHEQLRTILAEAEAQPHWRSNPEGFHACLDDVELLFRKLFFPAPSAPPPPPSKAADLQPSPESPAVQPSLENLKQCINAILPVLLMPKQSPALNIAGVTEFLQDLLQMSRKAVFHCVCEMPAILYLDLYRDLLPMYEYLDSLHWDPAIYKHIIVRHPQLLLLPVDQMKRNAGYLLGQGLSSSQILDMWSRRAGLLVESVKTLHGQLLGLREAGLPLQDLALPAALRPAPLFGPVPIPTGPTMSNRSLPTSASDNRTVRAVAALTGGPQAVYLYNQQRRRARFAKGVTVSLDGRFIAKTASQGRGTSKRIGVFDTLEEAARAYDAVVFERSGPGGPATSFNYPDEYANRT